MHSGDLTELGSVNLTDAEREALLHVMHRAKDFDQKMQKNMDGTLEGQLQKWTNPLNGWRSRWLSVDQQQGVLHYYTSEERKKHPPRGSLHLWGAVIAPSDEDSQTFSVNSTNGEVYKLRASDAKERQYWVSRLRNEVERCVSAHGGVTRAQTRDVPTPPISHPHTSTRPLSPPTSTTSTNTGSTEKSEMFSPSSPANMTTPSRRISKSKRLGMFSSRSKLIGGSRKMKDRKLEPSSGREHVALLSGDDPMLEVVTRLQQFQESFISQLESCSGTGLEPVERDVLLVRATSQAAVLSVRECLALLVLQQSSSRTVIASGYASSRRLSMDTESLVESRLTGKTRKERPKSSPIIDLPETPPPGHAPSSPSEFSCSAKPLRAPIVTSV